MHIIIIWSSPHIFVQPISQTKNAFWTNILAKFVQNSDSHFEIVVSKQLHVGYGQYEVSVQLRSCKIDYLRQIAHSWVGWNLEKCMHKTREKHAMDALDSMNYGEKKNRQNFFFLVFCFRKNDRKNQQTEFKSNLFDIFYTKSLRMQEPTNVN